MKKIVLTMVALLSMTVMQAQNNEKCECKKEMKERKAPKELTAEQRTDMMAKELSLTDAQKAQVLALNKEYKEMFEKGPRMGGPRPQKPKVDGETGATDKQKRPERPQLTDAQKTEMKQQKAKHEEYNKKLKKILNDDQYQKYEKMKMRGHGRHHGHGGPKGPRPERTPQD
ncbi:MAG: DUF4890 domain-containing protein [Prevotella sp.]|nr:DUF4890 domain-containing protein [Prevotella sp.]